MVPIDAQAPIGTTEKIVPIGAAPYRGAPVGTYPYRNPGHRLLAAARRACDHWADSPAARSEMRRQIAEVPPEHRVGLLAHFERKYPTQPKESDPWPR